MRKFGETRQNAAAIDSQPANVNVRRLIVCTQNIQSAQAGGSWLHNETQRFVICWYLPRHHFNLK